MGLFSPDSILMRGLNLIANIIILHFIWLLFSLPIFTIGTSTTALYYTTMKLIRTGEGYLFQNFLKSFKENFKQSTIIWLVMIVVGFLFITDIRYGFFLNNIIGKIMIVGCSIFLIPCLLVSLYIFPVQSKFENTIFENLKLSLLMSLRHIGLSLILIVVIGTILFLGFFFRPFMGLMLICGMGLIAYFSSNVFIMIFRKYIPEEIEMDLEKSGNRFE